MTWRWKWKTWVVVYSSADEFEIRPEPDRMPGLDFVRLDEPRKAKSRLHVDLPV